MSGDHTIKTVGLPMLTSEVAMDREQYEAWRDDLKGFAGYKNFLEALEGDPALPATRQAPESMPTSTEDEKAAKKAVKENDLAMVFLTASVKSPRAKACVARSKSTGYPSGVAHVALENLNQRFAKVDSFTATEMRIKLSKIKMKKGEDPVTFFDALNKIKEMSDQLTSDKITMSEYITQVFTGTSSKYTLGLRNIKEKKGDALTLDDLEDEVYEQYRMEHLGDSSDEEEADETALATPGQGWANKREFKGVCYNCNKKGHRAHECPEKNRNQGQGQGQGGRRATRPGKFKGKCHECGKYGHKKADCWEREANADKRPNNWKSSGERGLASSDNNSGDNNQDEFMLINTHEEAEGSNKESNEEEYDLVNKNELMLMTYNKTVMEFPDNLTLLKDPNIWVADSGTTVDNTGHQQGVVKTRDGAKEDGITDVSGSELKT